MKLFKPYDAENPAKGRATAETTSPGSTGKGTGGKSHAPATDKPAPGARKTANATSASAQSASGSSTPTKKTIPTPTRRQAEQARRDRIQPVLTRKEARLRDREARYKANDDAMAKVHARSHNVMIRDWVDHRFNLAEFALPGMVLVFVGTIIGSFVWQPMMLYSPYLIWAVFLALVLDTLIMVLGMRRQLKIHFPDVPTKRTASYAFSRSMLMRRSRVPAPRVKRGEKFVWPPAKGAE